MRIIVRRHENPRGAIVHSLKRSLAHAVTLHRRGRFLAWTFDDHSFGR